jgi:toxin YhaV
LSSSTFRRNGWTILLYPAFRAALLLLRERVRRVREQNPSDWQSNGHAKLLKRLVEIMLHEVPAAPDSPVFEQGNTIGKDARGWRRAKFLGRFRLLFRFDSRSKVIIYAWVNDETTLRARGSDSDPYVVFRRMLLAGDPTPCLGPTFCRLPRSDDGRGTQDFVRPSW